jgi:hypothetical protein
MNLSSVLVFGLCIVLCSLTVQGLCSSDSIRPVLTEFIFFRSNLFFNLVVLAVYCSVGLWMVLCYQPVQIWHQQWRKYGMQLGMGV